MIVNICQMFTSVLFKCNSRSNIVPGVLDVLPYPHRHPIRRHCVSPILGMGKPNTGRLSNFLKATKLLHRKQENWDSNIDRFTKVHALTHVLCNVL